MRLENAALRIHEGGALTLEFQASGEIGRIEHTTTDGGEPMNMVKCDLTGLGQSDVPSPHVSGDDSAPTFISMEMSHGIYVIPVRINGELTLRFIVDSGASDVSIPADIALTLLRTGTIEENDFVGDQHYRLGDGSTIKSARLMLRKLQVGNEVVQNVKASIGPVESVPLLGQSFLSKFGTWTLDNERHVLLLGPQRSATSNSTYASPELSWAQTADTRTQAAEKLPELTSSKRWLVVASRGDLNEAISVAQKYKPAFPETLVVKSENGQYGITIGRFDIVQNPSVLIEMVQAKRIPKDSYMSLGKRFISIAWQ